MATALAQANISDNGRGNDLYFRIGGTLYYTAERGNDTKVLGTGWDQYNLLVSVGHMAGSAQPDLVARGTDGRLWLYQGKADGTLAARIRMKDSTGWNGMSVVAGRGDYTGDGIADLITRNSAGSLLIHPGTGKATADAVLGTSVTAATTGWKDYTAVFSTGDNTGDGKTDLMAAVEDTLSNSQVRVSVSLDGVPDAKNAADALEKLIARGRPLIGNDWRPATQSGNGTAWEMATLRLKVVNGARRWTDFDWYMTKPGERAPSLVTDMPVPDWAM